MSKSYWCAFLALPLVLSACSLFEEGACYTRSVYPDGHVRHYCYNGHTEDTCEDNDGDELGYLGDLDYFEDWVGSECCEERGKYTILNPEDC